jgi:2-dehydro-3-deoxyphosphogluconate aldolase/(4S)-4-hydroxy-2-oxoglutarate aldolase
MTGAEVSDQLARHGVIPVITLDHPRQAGPLGRALVAGGLACAEITFRTSAAEAGLSALAEDPSLLVGAGTVVSTDQADRAVAAGARFIVMPGFDARLVEHCRALGVPVFPGVATASDVMAAVSAGLDTVKLFPAAIIGGTAMLAALAGPFPGVRFIPTGGVTAEAIAQYLTMPCVLAVGGSWIADRALLAAGDFEQIGARAADAVSRVAAARI